jgi:hydroxymethylbilane synthase
MKLRIAARRSDLARLQAHTVARALQKVNPALKIEFSFRESLGDQNAHDPLWKMPEKGVFTEDFRADLIEGRADLVVHSWKDLPIERQPGTLIVATLPREDARDLLLVHRQAWRERELGQPVRILSSSPRRSYNLQSFLKVALPSPVKEVQFVPVRGNIPTRLQKLIAEPVEGLVVAKAALDRLLDAHNPTEFQPVAAQIREILDQCDWMVLPLSVNPAAAAQGALAIEVREQTSTELRDLLSRIHCQQTFDAVFEERRVLGSYGGGCHQKIGVSIQVRSYGTIYSIRGLTDAGETLLQNELRLPQGKQSSLKFGEDEIFPRSPADQKFFKRVPIVTTPRPNADAFWVARADAWPESWGPRGGEVIWTAGIETWKKLAARGLWVHGCADGLGESEAPLIEKIHGRSVQWTKLSHSEGTPHQGWRLYPTYQLKPLTPGPSFQGKKSYFWMSGSSFLRALELDPSIVEAEHACGPGHTWEVLSPILGSRLFLALNLESWRTSKIL